MVAATVVSVTLGCPVAAAAPSKSPTESTVLSPLPRLIGGAGIGYAISYPTSDEHGRPTVANGQVYLPVGNPPPGGWPVVSWAKGTVGVGDGCAMSTALARGLPDPFAVALSEPLLTDVLESGIAVVSTDYIGLGTVDRHQYLNSESESRAVIDIVGAAADSLPELSQTWVAAGHSQGGAAALTVGVQAAAYGNSPDLRGVVAIAPSSNVENIIAVLTPQTPRVAQLTSITATLIYILYGLQDARPDIDINSYLSDLGRERVASAEDMCIGDLRQSVDGIAPQQLLSRPLSDPTLVAALRDYMAVPVVGYTRPVVIEQGLADAVVPPLGTTALAAQLLAGGAGDLTYLPIPGATHYDVVATTAADTTARISAMLR